jgi:hypothetical protein
MNIDADLFLGVSRELWKRRCGMIPVDGCVDDGAWRGWGAKVFTVLLPDVVRH